MKRSTVYALVICGLVIPATLFLGTQLKGRWHYLTSTLVIIETMLPFFLAFETRRPQARELVTVAVLCALAVAARVVILLPHFKPMTAVIMLSGIAFGPEVGFMTGAISGFASNFFFTQGPWTPWQMMAYGVGGFLAGAVFYRRRAWQKPVVLAVFGFVTVFALVGPLLDCCTLFTVGAKITWKFALAVFASGLPMNVSHAIACAATMLLLSKPFLSKLDRLRRKYGMMEARDVPQ